ncbi:FadR/GntR family transcriptional regulator [Paenibacillus daejeonensis]|uniref:FadR/GntR family transcriptional regulator n=1 Tax=Paenibacillus daejeonensis TaxID=135193 RepID=UPI000379342B|nr:FadR/GntR family transcriptional regulator [Paenibacillus daejeonensis]
MQEFARIKTQKIYEQIADRLQERIEQGGWRSGDKLPSTKELSEQFQVGRSTMREALSALKAKGLIEIRQGEGCFVRELTPQELELPGLLLPGRESVLELLEARKALEIANSAIAAVKHTEADLRAFEELLSSMKAHLGDEAEGEAADIRFHKLLAEATHNSIMVRLLDSISSQMETAIRETRRLQLYSNAEVSHRLWDEHQAIYNAVAKRDAQGAEQAMRTHLDHVEQVLRAYIKG